MAILQRLLARREADRAFRCLLKATSSSVPRSDELRSLAKSGEQALKGASDHFGLAFALGIAGELIASQQPWDERQGWVEQAVGKYELAIDLADAGKVEGAALLADVSQNAWEPGLSLEDRASLAACNRAGLLRAGEFRVRDPARAVGQLRRVVDRLQGYHPAWYYLGEAHLLAGDLDQAEAAWREGLARSPDDLALIAVLAKLPVDRVHQAAKDRDWRRLLVELSRLPVEAMPGPERLILEGDAYQGLGDIELARQAWEAALRADTHALGVRRRLRQLEKY